MKSFYGTYPDGKETPPPNDGGPIHPCDIRSTATGDVVDQHWGMSLRDYFAAKAMAGMVAREGWQDWGQPEGVAKAAYGFADAMISAREAKP